MSLERTVMGWLRNIVLRTGWVNRLGDYLLHYQREKAKELIVKDVRSKAIVPDTCQIIGKVDVANGQNDPSKIRFGAQSIIDGAQFSIVRHGGEITFGDFCFVGPGSRIWSVKKISIGNRVLISHNVNIHDSNSHPLDAHARHLDFKHIKEFGFQKKEDYEEQEIIIEDDVWIGYNASIMKGIRIGKGAVIAACSVVTKDVEPYTVVAGNPAVPVKRTN